MERGGVVGRMKHSLFTALNSLQYACETRLKGGVTPNSPSNKDPTCHSCIIPCNFAPFPCNFASFPVAHIVSGEPQHTDSASQAYQYFHPAITPSLQGCYMCGPAQPVGIALSYASRGSHDNANPMMVCCPGEGGLLSGAFSLFSHWTATETAFRSTRLLSNS
jgi:hypothetical protein